jgi:hypothetical protein
MSDKYFEELAFIHLMMHNGVLLGLVNLDDSLFSRSSANLPVQVSRELLDGGFINRYVMLGNLHVEIGGELMHMSTNGVAISRDSEHANNRYFLPALSVVLSVVVAVDLHELDSGGSIVKAFRHWRPGYLILSTQIFSLQKLSVGEVFVLVGICLDVSDSSFFHKLIN